MYFSQRGYGFQVEELYVEILYTILHMIGCDADRQDQVRKSNKWGM
jgi:hypothetical protein